MIIITFIYTNLNKKKSTNSPNGHARVRPDSQRQIGSVVGVRGPHPGVVDMVMGRREHGVVVDVVTEALGPRQLVAHVSVGVELHGVERLGVGLQVGEPGGVVKETEGLIVPRVPAHSGLLDLGRDLPVPRLDAVLLHRQRPVHL